MTAEAQFNALAKTLAKVEALRQSVKVAVVKAEKLVDALHKMLIEVKR